MSKNEQKRVNISKKRAKNTNTFTCKICDYNTSRHSNYLRHIETKKHLEKHKKVLFSVKSVNKKHTIIEKPIDASIKPTKKKKGKFYCELCDYKASQKSHYEKHLKTKKHTAKVAFFSGHDIKHSIPIETSTHTSTTVHGVTASSLVEDNTTEIDELKKQIYSIIEKQNLIKKETDDIKMKSKQGQVIYNNNISINFFLDTYCSNAQPIQDFISNMSFKLGDIMRNNQLVENFISKKLLKGLEEMPVTERPIHCTDQKRKNFIVKDERQGWVKDIATDSNSKLYTRVDQLHKKAYVDFYNEYDKQNPLPHDGEKEKIKFNISSQIINKNDDVNKVIIRDIAKQVDIYDALGGINESMLENSSDSEPVSLPFSTPNINGDGSTDTVEASMVNETMVAPTTEMNAQVNMNTHSNTNTNIKFSINIAD